MSRFGFKLHTPDDLLNKAEREFERYKNSNGDEKSDHAWNCVVTLLHLSDWIWHSDKGSLKRKYVRYGVFKKHLRETSEIFEMLLEYGNGAKHFDITKPEQHRITTNTTTAGGSCEPITILSSGKERLGTEADWSIGLTVGGRVLNEDFFEEAIHFWREWLANHSKN